MLSLVTFIDCVMERNLFHHIGSVTSTKLILNSIRASQENADFLMDVFILQIQVLHLFHFSMIVIHLITSKILLFLFKTKFFQLIFFSLTLKKKKYYNYFAWVIRRNNNNNKKKKRMGMSKSFKIKLLIKDRERKRILLIVFEWVRWGGGVKWATNSNRK